MFGNTEETMNKSFLCHKLLFKMKFNMEISEPSATNDLDNQKTKNYRYLHCFNFRNEMNKVKAYKLIFNASQLQK